MLSSAAWLRQEAQTTRLNISPSPNNCGLAASTPEEKVPSDAGGAVYARQPMLCLVDWQVPESSVLTTDLGSVDCE